MDRVYAVSTGVILEQREVNDGAGLNTFEHQPAKVAAMEGLWETQRGAPLKLFGWPDQEAEKNRWAIEIPKLTSLILTHDIDGEVQGLKDWPKDERPPVAWVFWSFRVMVGIGMLMILTGLMALVLHFKKRLFDTRWFQYWCMALAPSGFIAVLAGWFVTEIGRQPYIVYEILRTSEAVSPVGAPSIAISLTAIPPFARIARARVMPASMRTREASSIIAIRLLQAAKNSARKKKDMNSRPPGMRWLKLYPDGRLDTSVVWLEDFER